MMPAPDLQVPGYSCVLAGDPHSVRASLGRLVAAPLLAGLSDDARGTVEIVLAEVLNNVVEHAYKGKVGEIAVSLFLTESGVLCHVTDHGAPMPNGSPPPGHLPPAGDRLQDLQEGGFGWHLIHSLTQDLRYARLGAENRLTFLIPS